MNGNDEKLYVLMLSVHGLIRGVSPELGRDADTGGQVGYVLDLARALGRHPGVSRVDLVTRLVEDPAVGPDYAVPREPLGPGATLVRLPFGPRRYLRKELLWPHIDSLVDACVEYLRAEGRLPHVVHSHYADAGRAGVLLSQLLGIPHVHTGHSLGRTKRSRLLTSGRSDAALERQFNFQTRIAAEEEALENARLVVASTRQEVAEQWGAYENYNPRRFAVIPPAVDTSRFAPPPVRRKPDPCPWIDRFLADPDKPPILAICRPAPKKNVDGLVEAFASDPRLRERANLVILAGNRDDLTKAEEPARHVYEELLLALDRHDLWGHVAIPKRHDPEDVPEVYRLAAARHGIFVNPALTEPFGLTLLEAAASGLPVVATNDGGPRDILANGRNGILVDPRDTGALAAALLEALENPARRRDWVRNGLKAVRRTYTWEGHVERYVREVTKLLRRDRKAWRKRKVAGRGAPPARLTEASHLLASDIDDTLIGDREGLRELLRWLKGGAPAVAFGVATGRSLPMALEVLREWDVPTPDVVVAAVGSEIYHGPDLVPDIAWERHVQHGWRRRALETALAQVPGLTLQEDRKQGVRKLSYYVDPRAMPPVEALRRRLRRHGLMARLVYSQERYLDVLPIRASKGLALRYLAFSLGLPPEKILVAGDSGNDLEMLLGDTLAVVVANHKPELAHLKGSNRVYFARAAYACGILEGIAHYSFAPETVPC